MSFYDDYYLTDNPFPTTPVLDPNSDDTRINGAIYNPDTGQLVDYEAVAAEFVRPNRDGQQRRGESVDLDRDR